MAVGARHPQRPQAARVRPPAPRRRARAAARRRRAAARDGGDVRRERAREGARRQRRHGRARAGRRLGHRGRGARRRSRRLLRPLRRARPRPTPRTATGCAPRCRPAPACATSASSPTSRPARSRGSPRASARAGWPRRRAASGGFGYDPLFVPADGDGSRTMAELSDAEKDRDLAPRARRTGGGSMARRRMTAPAWRMTGGQGSRSRAAALSIGSNSVLIVLKLVAGAVTGSVAIITEAIHSAIDLLASIVAFFSVRQAETPADASHRYGHEKFENVAAGIEGMLILVGSGVIVYTAVDHLVDGTEIESLGFGIAVVAFATAVNLVVSQYLYRRAAARTRPRWPGTRRTCAPTRSPRSACWSASRSSSVTGEDLDRPGRRARDRRRDRLHRPAAWSRARGGCWSTRPSPRDETGRDPGGDRVFRRARRGGLPRAAHPPRRPAPLRRHARPVPLGHHARGGPRDRPQASRTRSARACAAPTSSSTSSRRTR